MAVIDPDFLHEEALFETGASLVAGIDEVGRGAWAGPVLVGVITVKRDRPEPPRGIRDSKLLSKKRRAELAPQIASWAHEAATGSASARECDELGMRAAVALAASRALHELAEIPDAVIVDGPLDLLSAPSRRLATLVEPHRWRSSALQVKAVVKADLHCVSVAAASIVAKVERDALMASWAESFPGFDFERNAGYPAPSHVRALSGYGLTSEHRRSWSFTRAIPWMVSPVEEPARPPA
jgi:ribonuclease HII